MLNLGTSFSSERNYTNHLNVYACWLSTQRVKKRLKEENSSSKYKNKLCPYDKKTWPKHNRFNQKRP